MDPNELRAKIMAIQQDSSLNDEQKAKARQQLMISSSKWCKPVEEQKENVPADQATKTLASSLLDENLKCGVCFNLCERPVTAPCQHNFCLTCFTKWVQQSKKSCPSCRAPFPSHFANNPRINTALACAIRLARNPTKAAGPAKAFVRIDNEQRPEVAFTTERAVRAGRANAASGRIMVNIPNDHFGLILPEHDPTRNQGVQVGDWWKDRLDCRQWGAHFPHVAGIAGQSTVGAQSVVLSGGYEDDKDEGEWFLYTGSGGRDLSGNKRVNKVQSFDQKFDSMNLALKLSCEKGLPVRVVRSFKEKRSAYAPPPETPVRYDGIYRIIRCWRKPGNQGKLMCRYLFVRCDNAAAPWSTSETGDGPDFELPQEAKDEMQQAEGEVFEICKDPFWDYDPVTKEWGWAKPAPRSQRTGGDKPKTARKQLSDHQKLLKQFRCGLCMGILKDPISTPCGHNFCKSCMDAKFAGMADQVVSSARSLRARKVPKPCPTCKHDIGDYSSCHVNREMMAVIQKLQDAIAQAKQEAKEGGEGEGAEEAQQEDVEDVEGEEEDEGEEEEGEEEEEQDEAEEGAVQADAAVASTSDAAKAAEAPAAAVAPAAAEPPKAASCKWQTELAALKVDFPSFDDCLIIGLLDDQGGDVKEVSFYLKRLSQPATHKRTPIKRPAGGRGRGRGAKKQRTSAKEAEKEGEDMEAEGAVAAVDDDDDFQK